VYDIIPEPEAEVYMTVAEFSASADDSINFQAGAVCTVVTKNSNGWWYVDMDGKEGWVPSSYLEKVSGGSSDSPTKPTKKPANTSEPAKEKPAKLEPKIVATKVELVKEAKRKEPVISHKPNVPTVQPRKTFSSNSTAKSVRKSSLRRSTSTDSGLNEDVDGNNPKITPMRSPPVVRTSGVPPRPSRPKASPAVPNGPKSPRPGTRSSLKPKISGPISVQVSPAARRKSEAASTITAGSNARVNVSDPLTNKSTKTPPLVRRPPPMKRSSNEDIPSSSKSSGSHSKKTTSAPEVSVSGLRNGTDRRPTAMSKTSSGPLSRLDSGSTPAMNSYKQELEKKFNKTPPSLPSSTSSSQQPKRPSPPNRPKGPLTKAPSGVGAQRPSAPPSRPQPLKSGQAKKPPLPVARPAAAPKPGKNPSYVTIASYSAEGALNFEEGVEVEVIQKKDDGWWFVCINNEEGWAPSTYIDEKTGPATSSPSVSRPPRPKAYTKSSADTESLSEPTSASDDGGSKPRPRPRPRRATKTFYRATDSFDEEGSMQLVKGSVYELKEKNDTGWWLLKHGDGEGWAPSNYLQQV